jgi:hypothetical protein
MNTNQAHSSRWILAASLLACAAWSSCAFGLECPCARCGHAAECQKVCRCVTEMKKVDVICWGYKDEDFCVPCPSNECEQHCETVCEDCDVDTKVESQPKAFVWTRWLPTFAESYTRRKLMKRTITKEVPSFKWVYEDVCEKCAKAAPATISRDSVRMASHEGSVEPAPSPPLGGESTNTHNGQAR